MEEGTKEERKNGRGGKGRKEAWRPDTKETGEGKKGDRRQRRRETKKKGAGNRKQGARKEINSE